ncbi:MAG: efflux transporter outer membrane subunit [Deltaproteobacteria bacterium]|nr:efflux transporter outer membrane subunit [Deltaproteobacteria bacterium]
MSNLNRIIHGSSYRAYGLNDSNGFNLGRSKGSNRSKCQSRLLGAVLRCETARLFVTTLTALALAGCSAVGADYVKPEMPAPVEWSRSLRGGLIAQTPEAQTLARWWTTLDDPDLSNLIERAVTGNLDLKKALARVREARARRGVAQAGLFPAIDTAGSASRSRSSEQSGAGQTRELYRLGFDATWEIDVFGRMRRSVEAAEGDLEASEADRDDVLVSLLAEVALNYVEARTLQTQLQVAEENLKAQMETLQLTEWRFEAGLVSRLDVEQAKANLENTRSQLPRLRSGIEEAKNRLAVLLGVFPGALEGQLSVRKPIPETFLEVAVGVPAEVLRRRPDVRRAERQLAAQTARVGIATADLYPRFTLPGSIGLEALSTNHLFSAGSRIASMSGSIAWTIFKGGAIRQNIEVQNALQEQALKQYETAILTALEDVENALVAYAEEQDRRQALSEATQAAQRAAELAHDQYASGLIDFQSVLDAERTQLSFQEQLVLSKGQVTSNLISLYKALGGGWTPLKRVRP